MTLYNRKTHLDDNDIILIRKGNAITYCGTSIPKHAKVENSTAIIDSNNQSVHPVRAKLFLNSLCEMCKSIQLLKTIK